jgi:hypothetical protein
MAPTQVSGQSQQEAALLGSLSGRIDEFLPWHCAGQLLASSSSDA